MNQLQAGNRYKFSFDAATLGFDRDLSLVAVTSCSCDTASTDSTGRPKNFNITQDNGHITFSFQDNSYCEKAFSFTRVSRVEEYLRNFQEDAVSFTNDFYFSSSKACDSLIEPGIKASDDLSLRFVTATKNDIEFTTIKLDHTNQHVFVCITKVT